MSAIEKRKRKSVRLEPDLLKKFKKYVGSFDTMLDCAEDLGVHFNSIPRILGLGTCSPNMKSKIEEKLNAAISQSLQKA